MRIDGIQLREGSSISNLVVASGITFPDLANEGELFFRSDSDIAVKGLYAFIAGAWHKISSAGANVTRRQQWTVISNERNFVVAGGYTVGSIDIFLNGLKLRTGDDLDASTSPNIVFAEGNLYPGDEIDIIAFE